MKLLKKLFITEISVEIQTCVYYLCILFFYCMVQLVKGSSEVNIWIMLQILLVAYVCQYIYVFFGNIEEAGRVGKKEFMTQLVIYGVYTAASYLGNWFDRNPFIMGVFIVYLIIEYLLVSWVFYMKRKSDTKDLNELLEEFKKKGGNET